LSKERTAEIKAGEIEALPKYGKVIAFADSDKVPIKTFEPRAPPFTGRSPLGEAEPSGDGEDIEGTED